MLASNRRDSMISVRLLMRYGLSALPVTYVSEKHIISIVISDAIRFHTDFHPPDLWYVRGARHNAENDLSV